MIDKNIKSARKAVESLYDAVATITIYREQMDPLTKITSSVEMQLMIEQPCYLSVKTMPVAMQTETKAEVNQMVKLFIAPEVEIYPGSKITVTHRGRVSFYACSGVSAIYGTHQEVELKNWEEWA